MTIKTRPATAEYRKGWDGIDWRTDEEKCADDFENKLCERINNAFEHQHDHINFPPLEIVTITGTLGFTDTADRAPKHHKYSDSEFKRNIIERANCSLPPPFCSHCGGKRWLDLEGSLLGYIPCPICNRNGENND